MSAHRLGNDLREMVETDSLQIGNTDKGEGVVFERGSSVPADAATGYAKGCLFVNTSGTTPATMLYINIGTLSSCQFQASSAVS